MALSPKDNFTYINGPTADYPLGSAKDASGPGLKNGTEIRAEIFNDIWGIFQRILLEAGITASGAPDTVLESQYYTALMSIVEGVSRGAAASETAKGAIEIATQAEVNAGTDAERAVTPARLSEYVSTEIGAGVGEWQSMTLENGWTATRARYRLLDNGKNLQIDISGLDASAITAAPFFTMPDGYRPTSSTSYQRVASDAEMKTLVVMAGTYHFMTLNITTPSAFTVSFSVIAPMD